ncbi:MAG: aconitate hydratase AcnA [Rhodobacteraceae bacterium]|nr:aconitate hydratase AcnA [Paracoccaceae bacterium]
MTACANPELLRPLPGHDGLQFLSLAAAEATFGPLFGLPRALLVLAEDILWRLPAAAARQELDRLRRAASGAGAAGPVSFAPGRALLQDFLGVPLMTDLASMRDALMRSGKDPRCIEPVIPVDFVVDHSLSVRFNSRPDAAVLNRKAELASNGERFAFIKWCESAFDRVRVIPPGRGIMHQVNLEWLSKIVRTEVVGGRRVARPDTMIGTDSHTTMVNALGVLGWGVGGIEAEAAMLGLPIEIEAPRVVGLELTGKLPPGATATDLVLHVTERLRGLGVVDAFVEVFGAGLADLPLADRATIANMCPEYGATCAYFPIDAATLDYLAMTGREAGHLALVEAYARAQGLWSEPGAPPPHYTERHHFDLSAVEPVMAGPTRPEQKARLSEVPATFAARLAELKIDGAAEPGRFGHGAVALAAITSCTNTANPALMIAAGLLARNAVARGLAPPPWVKCSLAPGSRAVTDYLDAAGLTPALETLGFHTVGYGCTTCNGNSGPLAPEWRQRIEAEGLATVAVLSGNRNFEGRIHPLVKAAYLGSPQLVIAAALAGSVAVNLATEPLGVDPQGQPVTLAEIAPDPAEVAALVARFVTSSGFRAAYAPGNLTTEAWEALAAPATPRFPWQAESLFIRPSEFPGLAPAFDLRRGLAGVQPLLVLGDGITTDHISPNGAIRAGTPAAEWLLDHGATPELFGNFGLRRGNSQLCARGMFDNPLLENELCGGRRGNLAPGANGPVPVWTAASERIGRGVLSAIFAGRNYGAGSSRDWAAKGLRLLGVVVVVAESFERIHRSNLIGMGVLPLIFPAGIDRHSLALTGNEEISITPAGPLAPRMPVRVAITRQGGEGMDFVARLDAHSPSEMETLAAGGVLPQILSRLMHKAA